MRRRRVERGAIVGGGRAGGLDWIIGLAGSRPGRLLARWPRPGWDWPASRGMVGHWPAGRGLGWA